VSTSNLVGYTLQQAADGAFDSSTVWRHLLETNHICWRLALHRTVHVEYCTEIALHWRQNNVL